MLRVGSRPPPSWAVTHYEAQFGVIFCFWLMPHQRAVYSFASCQCNGANVDSKHLPQVAYRALLHVLPLTRRTCPVCGIVICPTLVLLASICFVSNGYIQKNEL